MRRAVLKLVLNRFGLGVLTLFAASVLIFVGTEILPGDLASAILQNTATPETLAKMRLDLGLDRPAYLRFFEWLFGALHGDFGKSLANGRDVLTEIAPRFANTMFLAAYAAVVAVPLAIGLGLLAAIRQGGVFDRLVNVVTLMTISVPEYFLAYLLIKYVAVELGLVSLARQRLVRHAVLRPALYRLPADADAGAGHRRAHDAHDARLGAGGHGEPLYRDGDPQGPDQDAHRRSPRAAERARADHLRRRAQSRLSHRRRRGGRDGVRLSGPRPVDGGRGVQARRAGGAGLRPDLRRRPSSCSTWSADILAILSNPRLRQPR